MSETSQRQPESGEEREKPEEVRELETLEEKLDFLRDKFLRGGEVKPTWDVAEEGEEYAKEEFGGDLFLGEFTQEIAQQIRSALGVDLQKSEPDFEIEDVGFKVWRVPESEGLYILLRTEGEETEILAYDEMMIETIFGLDLGSEE